MNKSVPFYRRQAQSKLLRLLSKLDIESAKNRLTYLNILRAGMRM